MCKISSVAAFLIFCAVVHWNRPYTLETHVARMPTMQDATLTGDGVWSGQGERPNRGDADGCQLSDRRQPKLCSFRRVCIIILNLIFIFWWLCAVLRLRIIHLWPAATGTPLMRCRPLRKRIIRLYDRHVVPCPAAHHLYPPSTPQEWAMLGTSGQAVGFAMRHILCARPYRGLFTPLRTVLHTSAATEERVKLG